MTTKALTGLIIASAILAMIGALLMAMSWMPSFPAGLRMPGVLLILFGGLGIIIGETQR